MEKGCVHIYHGDGKGKTTCGMGLCIRAAGAGLKVMIYQFLKDNSSSERKVLGDIPGITLIDGEEDVKFTFHMSDAEKAACARSCSEAFETVTSRAVAEKQDVLFLDELLHLINKKMIDEDQVVEFLEHRPDGMEVIMTGCYPSERLKEKADYVSHIIKEKHPFDKHLAARVGIER